MTTKTRLDKLEQTQKAKDPDQILIRVIGTDPTDPLYVIIDPHSKNPVRMLRADLEAEHAAKQAAGEQVIIISHESINKNSN